MFVTKCVHKKVHVLFGGLGNYSYLCARNQTVLSYDTVDCKRFQESDGQFI